MRRSAAENGVICIYTAGVRAASSAGCCARRRTKSSSAPLFVQAWAAIGSSKLQLSRFRWRCPRGRFRRLGGGLRFVGVVVDGSESSAPSDAAVSALSAPSASSFSSSGGFAFKHLLDFLLQFDGGELQQADGLLQLGSDSKMFDPAVGRVTCFIAESCSLRLGPCVRLATSDDPLFRFCTLDIIFL